MKMFIHHKRQNKKKPWTKYKRLKIEIVEENAVWMADRECMSVDSWSRDVNCMPESVVDQSLTSVRQNT